MKYLATFSSFRLPISELNNKGKGSPYSIAELIPVLGSQPAGDVSHKPGGRLPLLSARPAVTLAVTLGGCYKFYCLVNRGTTGVNTLPIYCYPTASRLRLEPRPFCA